MTFAALEDLGRRICIIGGSNSGKSTLALAVAAKLDAPAVHLDRLRFVPHTDWQMRPEQEFADLHDDAIKGDSWIIDGNYSRYAPQRLARASGIIWLNMHPLPSLWRYVRRALFEKTRAGGLDGGRDSVKLEMIHHILVANPRNARRYGEVFLGSGHPNLRIRSMKELGALFGSWGLSRPI